MNFPQLVLFWRDQTTRCFTSWHFQPSHSERADSRAAKFLALLLQFTNLQIYGAALDELPLIIEEAKPAPKTGTAERLQVDLYPEKDLNPRLGINLIKFSVPGPVQELIDLVDSKNYKHPSWLRLEEEVLPYLCLPDGTKVKPKGERLYRAEILYLDTDRQPQPHQPPLAAAITRTTEDLEIAQRSFQSLKTQREHQRVEKYQSRLDSLYTWQHLEQDFFDQVENLQLLDTEAPLPSELDSEARPALVDKSSALPSSLTQSQSAAIAGLMTQSQLSKDESRSEGEIPQMSQLPRASQQKPVTQLSLYLPLPLTPEQAEVWKDVPEELFRDPSWWMNRSQLKEIFAVSERSYFRWIDNLSLHGLQRSLQAQQDLKVRLFYRPDIDQAVAATKADIESHPRRGRLPKALSAPSAQQPVSSIAPSPTIQTRTKQAALPALESLETNREITTLRAQLQSQADTISHLQFELAQFKLQLDSVNQKQAAISDQLPQARIIELLSQFSSFDQFTVALKKLNSQINKLALQIASNETKSKPKPKTKSKTKTKSKPAPRAKRSPAKVPAKVAPRSKTKQKKKASTNTRQLKT